jgi:hypothetical protein
LLKNCDLCDKEGVKVKKLTALRETVKRMIFNRLHLIIINLNLKKMKKILLLLFFLISAFVIGQEKIKVLNGTEIYDNNGKLFKFYGHGAILNLIKKNKDSAEVEIDGKAYTVHSKFYDIQPKKQIKIGMNSYEVVSIIGQPDDTSSFETQYSISKTYIYGHTYYHFDNDKLTAINRY